MSGAALQLLAVDAAFWVALGDFCRRERDPALRRRALAGLVAGAAAAHAGWWLLHLDVRLAFAQGASLLFVPFGVLAAAPRRGDPRRARHLHASFAGLPLAIALARVGCVLRGCCPGVAGTEVAGLLALFALSRALPGACTAPCVTAGIGALRLLLEPLRARAPLPTIVPVEAVALALVATGIALARGMLRARGGADACRDPGAVSVAPSATRSKASCRR